MIILYVQVVLRIWPAVVKERIRDTYMYFGGSLAATAGAAVAISRNPAMMNLMMKNSWMVCRLVEYMHHTT